MRLLIFYGMIALTGLIFFNPHNLDAQTKKNMVKDKDGRIFDEELGRWLTQVEIGKEVIYFTEKEAVELILKDSATTRKETRLLTPAQKSCVEERIGWKFPETSFDFFIGETGDTLDKYAVIQNTIGKYRPMTYIVGIDSNIKVSGVEMLVYRESRGAEVRKARFTYQYIGRSSSAPLRLNRDVMNISGATMSVRSLSAGVKRALVLTEELYVNSAISCETASHSKKESRGFFDRLFGN